METKEIYNSQLKQGNIFEKIQKQVAVLLGSLIVLALVVNLALLTYLGPKGEEISKLRNEQEQQSLKNDLMRAELENIKVNSQIETKAKSDLQLVDSDVMMIDAGTMNTTASNE